MQQQLTKLKLLVKAELEILRMCLDCDSQSTMTSLIERNINKLDQELRNLELILCRLDERPQLSEKEKDRLDTIKLNISKLLIQNEKIFNSEPQFKEILNQVPRIQNEDSVNYTQTNTISIHNQSQNSKYALKNIPSEKISSQQGFYKTSQKEQGKPNKSFQQSQQNQQQQQQSQKQNQQSQSQQSKSEQPVEMQQQYQIVRSNVDNLLNEMNKINMKIDTHKHDDYQRQIDKLRDDNSRIKADYQMLKQDNTELMFINNDIKKAISQIEAENQLIIQELTIFREQQYQPVTLTGQSRVSNIYLPYDENKAQEAEILLNKLKQN